MERRRRERERQRKKIQRAKSEVSRFKPIQMIPDPKNCSVTHSLPQRFPQTNRLFHSDFLNSYKIPRKETSPDLETPYEYLPSSQEQRARDEFMKYLNEQVTNKKSKLSSSPTSVKTSYNIDNKKQRRERDRLRKKKKRQDEYYRKVEQTRETAAKKVKRSFLQYRQKEQRENTYRKKRKRKDPVYKETEQQRDTISRKIKRKDPVYGETEKQHNTSSRKSKRKDAVYRETEQQRDTISRKSKRKDPVYGETERQYNTSSRKSKRKDAVYRETEQQRDTISRKSKRKDPVYGETEKQYNTSSRKSKRNDPVYRDTEQQRNTISRKSKRKDPVYRETEQQYNTIFRKRKRGDPVYRETEQRKNNISRKRKRTDNEYKVNERQKIVIRQKRRQPATIEVLISHFHEQVQQGPIYICTSCNQLFYKHSVVSVDTAFSRTNPTASCTEMLNKCLTQTKSVSAREWICTTCLNYIKKGKMPPAAVANGMTFPNQGPLQDLNLLELTLLAPMLPFMRIHQAPRGKQYRLHGNMVLVPSNVTNTVQTLPRLPDNTSTIKAKLKRRLRYKHHVYSLNIRPAPMLEAAEYLSTNGSLYRKQGIQINTNSMTQHLDLITREDILTTEPETSAKATSDSSDNDEVSILDHTTEEQEISKEEDNPDSDADWIEEDENAMRAGVTDTLLTPPDFIEPSERDMIYNFAPAEGNRPVSVFAEKYSEEMSFPGIFCGQARKDNGSRIVPVTYSEIVKSELKNRDRRCAQNVENIFFKTKKIQMKHLIDQTNLALRKVKTEGKHYTAKDVRGQNAQDLLHFDQGFKILKNLRGSPPYFQAISKDLFAMIRQLGPTTFFCSLSAAETHWLHLLRVLGQLIDGKMYTDTELKIMTWQEKSRLIQSDPITCSRHFDYSLQCFLRDVVMSTLKPIGKVTDFFLRIEFQQRGSPHVHMMLWCADAPVIHKDDDDTILKFIDTYLTCAFPSDPEFAELVHLQRHRHSHTCKRHGKKKCRFNFPKPPMKKSVILKPLDTDSEDKTKWKKLWNKVYSELNDMKDGEDISHDELLKRLNVTEEEYILAVRSSISTTSVFLKRSPSEIRINSYNETCLKAWRANMDLQYIIDVYACAMYVASYVTKSQRGMSELLRKACKEANSGNKSLKEQMRIIANKFLNAVEISAQEACYLAIGLPLKRSTRQTVFINTSPPQERVILLKSQNQLEILDEEDDNIHCANNISRYATRIADLENITLAYYVAYYDTNTTSYISRAKALSKKTTDNTLPEQTQNDEHLNEDDLQSSAEDNDCHPGTNSNSSNHLVLKKREKPRIIRHVNFNPDTDYEKFCRELLMLYTPWRNEDTDILGGYSTYAERYADPKVKQLDDNERKLFEPYHKEMELAEMQLQDDAEIEDRWDNIAPNTEHHSRHDRNLYQQQTPKGDNQEQYDIAQDLNIQITNLEDDINTFNELPDEKFRKHMRTLTQRQTEFVYDTIHHLKTKDSPLYRFLSGGAGVGKSFVIKALYQMALKYFNRGSGQDFTSSRVVLMAPTGKAAYHIHGNTIHSTLKLAANQKLQHKPLSSNTLNTLQNQLGEEELIIIDEISMVGFKLLNCIHQRLIEIKQSDRTFGGISVVDFGDLFQLKPVMDSLIFQPPRSEYMPLALNLWQEHFKMTELTEIMRQKDSKQFAALLNRLREGKQTNSDISFLKSRAIPLDNDSYPYKIPHIFIRNEDVNSHNSTVFYLSQSVKCTVKANDRVIGNHSPEVCEKILNSFQNKGKDTPQLPLSLQLAEGLAYEITVNINTEDGLTNGASCILMKIQLLNEGPSPVASGVLWVRFSDQQTGAQLRKDHKHLYSPGILNIWTPIVPLSRQYQAGYKGEAQVHRLQFPLRPAAAKTVHRSQGDMYTVDRIVVDLTTNRKLDHIHYVALSRVQSIEGLNVRHLQEDKISISPAVQEEMVRLRAATPELSLLPLYHTQDLFKIAFLNANSLNRHIEDVRSDFNLRSADIIAFCETRFTAKDTDEKTQIHLYNTYRQDSNYTPNSRTRPFYGLAVYTKSRIEEGYPLDYSADLVELTVLKINSPIPSLYLVFLYKPPNVPLTTLMKQISLLCSGLLSGKSVVFMGDFNVDWQSNYSKKKQLLDGFNHFGFRQLISSPTTDDRTLIDLAFTNIATDFKSGTLEVYYSPHKVIWIAF